MPASLGESSVNFNPNALGDTSIPGGSVGIGQWNKVTPAHRAPMKWGLALRVTRNRPTISAPSWATASAGSVDLSARCLERAPQRQFDGARYAALDHQIRRPKVDNSDPLAHRS